MSAHIMWYGGIIYLMDTNYIQTGALFDKFKIYDEHFVYTHEVLMTRSYVGIIEVLWVT